jgi:hypothetical protein
MKTKKFHDLWKWAITVEEPQSGPDNIGIGGFLDYTFKLWGKNPIKGTIIAPTLVMGLIGTLGYLATKKLYRKITDPNDAKANLKSMEKYSEFISQMPQSQQDELTEKLKNMSLYNAQVNIQTIYDNHMRDMSWKSKNWSSEERLAKLKNENTDYYKFYKKHIMEYYFSKDIYPSLQKTYNKKIFKAALKKVVLDTVTNNNISKFNFLFLSQHFSSSSYLEEIQQESLEIAITNNNLPFVKHLLEDSNISAFNRLKMNSFNYNPYNWDKINNIIQEKQLDNSLSKEVLEYLSPLIAENNQLTLFSQFKKIKL